MKTILITLCLFFLFGMSYGQNFRLWESKRSDTIPTILLCADTSNIVTLEITDRAGKVRFDGLTAVVSVTQVTTFPVIGYRVMGNILYTITSKKQLIDGSIYLDDKKRLLPPSFTVFSFVDRKQQP